MKRPIKHWAVAFAAAVLLGFAAAGRATQQTAPAEPAGSAEQPPQTQPPAFTAAQLDQMTAPIALYPDPLLGMILTAATYPLEIVEASRWLEQDDHAALRGTDLTAALADQDWDRSVKALVAVPEVLRMMNTHIEWTEQLGNAFLSQQTAVMDSIQDLRQRATDAGALHSSPQQIVSNADGAIEIEPESPDLVYVPCYTPAIYGPWPWPAYPPFYVFPTPGYCYPGAVITFGIGLPIFGPYWGWGRWNWRRHGFYVVPRRYPGGVAPRPWLHNPAHRRNVPYREGAMTRRFLGPNAGRRRGIPGFRPGSPPRRALPPIPRTAPMRHMTPMPHRAAPAYRSPGSRPPVRSESARGAPERAAPRTRGESPPAHTGGRPPR